MNLIRDERIAELNELLVRCKDASLHYFDAAEWAQEAGLAAILKELAEQRQSDGRKLSRHIRDLGDLPDAVDADRESLSRMGAMVKAALSHDPHALSEALAENAVRLEQGIAEQAERALSTAISGGVRTSVQLVRDSALAALRQLER